MSLSIVYVTYPNKRTAEKITNILLEKHLVACVNIFPVHTGYLWQSVIQKSHEFVSILKTKPENYDAVKKEIKRLHPYTVPCVIRIDADANPEFEDWVRTETKKKKNKDIKNIIKHFSWLYQPKP